MEAVVAAFNQEKALVGAFSVITNLRMELFEALVTMGDLLVGEQRVSGGELRVSGHKDGRQHGGLHPLVVVRVDADLGRRYFVINYCYSILKSILATSI